MQRYRTSNPNGKALLNKIQANIPKKKKAISDRSKSSCSIMLKYTLTFYEQQTFELDKLYVLHAS